MPLPADSHELPTWISDDAALAPYLQQIQSQAESDTAIQFWSIGGFEILCRIFDDTDRPIRDAAATVIGAAGAAKFKALRVRNALKAAPEVPRKRSRRPRRFSPVCVHGSVVFDGGDVLLNESAPHFQEPTREFRVPPRNFSAKAQVVLEPWEHRDGLHPAAFWVGTKRTANTTTTGGIQPGGTPMTVNITGSGGNFSFGNKGVTTQNSVVYQGDSAGLLRALRDSLADPVLAGPPRERMTDALDIIEAEFGKPERNEGLVREAASTVRTVLEGAAGSVLGGAATNVDWSALLQGVRTLFGA